MSAVLGTIEAQSRDLFREGEAILVAVSGGLDSMVLLHALHQFAEPNQWRLVAAHFNHSLRGNASRADQRFVEKTAKQLCIKCITDKWTQDAQSIKQHGLEMAARVARLDFLARSAREHQCVTVALAHHRDDQAETFLWRLMRGAGGKGLGGMQALDDFPGHPKIKIARPLLQLAKRDLLQFAEREAIKFREDASNTDPRHLRNRIRHELLPEWRRNFHPEIERAILQSQDLVRTDADFASTAARDWLASTQRTPFGQIHPALQRWIIWHQMIKLNLTPEFNPIESLRKNPGVPVSINPNQTIHLDPGGKLHLRKISHLTHRPNQIQFIPSTHWAEHTLAKTQIRCRIAPRKPKANQGEIFDAGRVGGRVLLRHWRAGDRFQPIGMKCPVKLQDLLTNAKIPATEKRQRVLACTETGEIFWVQGLRIGEIAKTRPETTHYLGWICGESL